MARAAMGIDGRRVSNTTRRFHVAGRIESDHGLARSNCRGEAAIRQAVGAIKCIAVQLHRRRVVAGLDGKPRGKGIALRRQRQQFGEIDRTIPHRQVAAHLHDRCQLDLETGEGCRTNLSAKGPNDVPEVIEYTGVQSCRIANHITRVEPDSSREEAQRSIHAADGVLRDEFDELPDARRFPPKHPSASISMSKSEPGPSETVPVGVQEYTWASRT